MKVAVPTVGDRPSTTMTAPLRSRLGSPFRAINWASQRRKELVAFQPDVRAEMHSSQFHCYQSFGDQFFGSRAHKGAVLSA
jgi:hypothetical protein